MTYPLTVRFSYATEAARNAAIEAMKNQALEFIKKDTSRWQEIIEEVNAPFCSRCQKYFPDSERRTDENSEVVCEECWGDDDEEARQNSLYMEAKMEERKE